MIGDKTKLEDFTEEEFLNIVRSIGDKPQGLTEKQHANYFSAQIRYFEEITEHPSRSDLLFYPREGAVDSPEGILNEVKDWRERSGKPGFKPA
jgi:hypothetical protein